MGNYFTVFETLVWQIVFICLMFVNVRFFYRVFKYKAKIVSNSPDIIILGIADFIVVFCEIIILAQWMGFFASVDLGISPVLFVFAVVNQNIFANNDEVFIFFNKIYKVDEMKVEHIKVSGKNRVIVTTNQKVYRMKIYVGNLILKLSQKEYDRIKPLFKQ